MKRLIVVLAVLAMSAQAFALDTYQQQAMRRRGKEIDRTQRHQRHQRQQPQGKFLGNFNNNPYDPDSVSNPYGQYGSPYSPDSINNPYGRYGNPYSPDSPHNPYGRGAKIYAPD